jgi:hypothetical protein
MSHSSTQMKKEPLLVHLVFHPESPSARELAQHVHRQLNSDIIVPGLRVPTVFCPACVGCTPPARLRFDFAERNFVVLLADDRLSIDEAWCDFCAEAWASCQNNAVARCVPFQLSERCPQEDSSYLKPFVISSRQSNKREYCLTCFPLRRRESWRTIASA